MAGPGARRLYLLFTPAACSGDPWWTLREALRGGVDLVQWRVKQRDPAGLRRALALCTEAGVPVIVNDDVELAVAAGAAGAHVGQGDLPAAAARALLGPDRWLGVSTHSTAEIDAARAAGADHLGFGPLFPTATKGYTEGQPPGALREAVVRATPLPVFAIGGISPATVARVVAEGCRRIAVSAALLQATDPAGVARALRAALATT
ncbi:MAG: thiamine phosphate synthase [Planctomycetes bacterium]|nr:thiamine phosphate synthase [Planctomycetota bacterium]